jgi:peptidoglycan/xylan/chitin deacetylase (PgdA/CDA1 family)
MNNLFLRINGKYRRTLATNFCRRVVLIKSPVPIVSFSFDDAPKTAFKMGGAILNSIGAKATYYLSLGLLGQKTEVGKIATPDDLALAVDEGHELGCHSYDHLDAWHTTKQHYMESVISNRKALFSILPNEKFESFAYPKSGPTLSVKYELQNYFLCCRGGGQVANIGHFDLNLVKSYFIDRRLNLDFDTIKQSIDNNTQNNGWLIFSTHDVSDEPSIYGCNSNLLQRVVEYSAQSGALLLPVSKACKYLVEMSKNTN